MVIFENRSAVYLKVNEHRKRRKMPFAARHSDFWIRHRDEIVVVVTGKLLLIIVR